MPTTPVADGQALSVRLARPRGWEDVRWDAGAYVSVRQMVDDDELVEVTPKIVRLRKRYLDPHERKRQARAEG